MTYLIVHFIFATIATIGFGILFQGPKRILWRGGLIGGVAWVVLTVLKNEFGIHSFSANFLASVTISLISEMAARVYKEPATVFTVPAIIPLVPGIGIYYGINLILNNHVSYGGEVLMGAVMDSCAIALGIMMVSGAFRALKTGQEMARYRQLDLLGTSVLPDLQVMDSDDEQERL